MVTVCAWCERYLGPGVEGPGVTHGICDPCAARQRWAERPVLVVARHRADLRDVLEQLLRGEPAVRIVVDRRVGDRRRSRDEPVAGDRRGGPDRRHLPADATLM
jgi:hypothetical protein